MTKIRNYLQGKKTYLVAAGAVIAVVIAWASGDLETPDAVRDIVAAIIAVTVRAGVEQAKPQ